MITLLMLVFTIFSFANSKITDPSRNWISAIEIVDKHEFYKNNEVIQKPQNSWQLLFGVSYLSSSMNFKKDCVYYKTPGDSPGILKIITKNLNENCESSMLSPGDWEKTGIKSLQFVILDTSLKLHLTLDEYKTSTWDVEFINKHQKIETSLLLSSAEFKTNKLIYLAPDSASSVNVVKKTKSTKPILCHDISEDCTEVSVSTCSQCSEGWYEIPNGCFQSPKYCGTEVCGQKNAPACRRGFKYQRVRKDFDCMVDSSYVYCAKGLEVHCQGKLAYCR